MTYIGVQVAVVDGKPRHVCYSTDDGIHKQRVGCSHQSPRSAIAHADELQAREPAPSDAPEPSSTRVLAGDRRTHRWAPVRLPGPVPASTEAAPPVISPGDGRALLGR